MRCCRASTVSQGANLVYTIPFNDGQVTWDLLPGFLLNLDQNDTDNKAWGMTYSSRAAVYDVIPQSANVLFRWLPAMTK